jgi:hypothetical protein
MIGNCDNCDRQNVPVSNGQFCGCDTTQCFICQHDVADPYGELEELGEPEVSNLQHAVAMAVRGAYEATSELIKLRCDPEAARFVAAEEGNLFAVKCRIDLLLSEIRADAEPKLRVVR